VDGCIGIRSSRAHGAIAADGRAVKHCRGNVRGQGPLMRAGGRTIRLAAAGVAVLAVAAAAGFVVARSANRSASGTVTGPREEVDGTNPFRTGHTLVIPHGGGDGLFPEDTMIAFQRTMAMGADVVDVDLQLAGDGTVIVFHDATVDRMTGAHGDVRDMTYAQLSKLDAGYTFQPAGSDTHPFRSQGVTIPTLDTVLDAFPTTLFSVDLKNESLDIVAPVCAALRAHHRSNDVFVGSNSDPQIFAFRKACPDVRTSAIAADFYAARDARASDDPNFVPAVTVDQPPYRANGRTLVDAASLTWSHAHGIAILTWVVNDEADMRTLVGLGVDGIYTSYPNRLLKILGRCTAACASG
jgi:glycerophosphoryl diester phosphodiesterase